MLSDPVVIALRGDHGDYMLVRGRETFYVRCDDAEDLQHFKVSCWACDHLDELITFETTEEARKWSIETLDADPMEHLPEASVRRYEEKLKKQTDFSDLPLFEDQDVES